MKQPFPKTWWVEETKFLAGGFPGSPEEDGTPKRIASLIAAGIRTFISLQETTERNRDREAFPNYEPILKGLESQAGSPLAFLRFPIPDCTAPSAALAANILDVIDASLANGRRVYLHCWGGHGRTATVVGCWLVRHGASSEEALKRIRQLRAEYPELVNEPAPQTNDQRDLVRKWAGLDPALSVRNDVEDCRAKPVDLHNRYMGAMFGLAVGDAVGTTLEFKPPGSFQPIRDMVGGGPFGLQAGQWTDDTSMALCLAESLIHCSGSDSGDQMRRYVDWWKQGHLSSTGKCFDIGNTTAASLRRFLQNGNPLAGSNAADQAGNGSLMRLAPIPLAFRTNIDSASLKAAESSRTTHGATEAVDACRFMTVIMIRALEGASKDDLLHADLWKQSLHSPTEPLAPKVLAIARGSYKTKQPPAIRGSGYVIDSLEAALWAFHRHDTYEQAVLAAANLGDDADTTAAVCGQLGGAFYGQAGIPAHWVERIAMHNTIAELAGGLFLLSNSPLCK